MSAKFAFVGFGEINTDRAVIEQKCDDAIIKLKDALGPNIHSAGPINDAPGYQQADEAIAILKKIDFDALIVCIAGWIPTHAVIRVIDHFRHKPMLLWGLCGWEEDGRIISTADQAGSTALRYTMQELGYQFHYVTSIINHPEPIEEITNYLSACSAAAKLRGARMGTMGYRDMLLYGTTFDGLSLRRHIGVEVEPIETLEMYLRANSLTNEEIAHCFTIAKNDFTFTAPCSDDVLEPSVRFAVALSEKIKENSYKAITLVDVDGMKKLLNLPPAFIFNLVDRLCQVCTIPENDILGSITQLMVNFTTGQIAPYAEFYEFFEDGFLMGVPDFIPREATLGEAIIKPSTFGLLSTSLLNVSKYKDGEMTLCRLFTAQGKYKMHIFKANAKQAPKWEESGWAPPAPQLPSLKVTPQTTMEEFKSKVASQHIIIAYGDQIEKMTHLCNLLNIEIV